MLGIDCHSDGDRVVLGIDRHSDGDRVVLGIDCHSDGDRVVLGIVCHSDGDRVVLGIDRHSDGDRVVLGIDRHSDGDRVVLGIVCHSDGDRVVLGIVPPPPRPTSWGHNPLQCISRHSLALNKSHGQTSMFCCCCFWFWFLNHGFVSMPCLFFFFFFLLSVLSSKCRETEKQNKQVTDCSDRGFRSFFNSHRDYVVLFQMRLQVTTKANTRCYRHRQTGRHTQTDKHGQSFCFKINRPRPNKTLARGPFSKECVSHLQNFMQFSDVGLLGFNQLVHYMPENTQTSLYPSHRQTFCLLQLELVSKQPCMLCLLPGYLHFPALSSWFI